MVLLSLDFYFTPSEAPGQAETDLGLQCPEETFPVPWGFILVQKRNPQQEDAWDQRLPFSSCSFCASGVAVCSFAIEKQSVEIIASNIVEHL